MDIGVEKTEHCMGIGTGIGVEEMVVNKMKEDKTAKKYGDELEIRSGSIQFIPKQLSALDVIDIITKSINCGKVNNTTKMKIINNVVKELKEFYGN